MPYLGGTGTEGDKWKVGDIPSFVAMTEVLDDDTKHFEFVEKVDLLAATSEGGALYNGGDGWIPKGTELNPFRANVDFNGFGFDGLKFNQTNAFSGLWRYAIGAYFRNGSIGGDVQSNQASLGLIAGRATNCTFDRLTSTGVVTNTRTSVNANAGAYAGIEDDCLFTDCNNFANIISTNNIDRLGGFVGLSSRNIEPNTHFIRCANYGLIDTTSPDRGPFFGLSSGGSNESRTSNCFNDRDASGISDLDLSTVDGNQNVTNLSTLEAQTLSTYVNAGWSMASLANYIDETWAIDDGNAYPVHGWAVQAGSRITVNLAGTPLVNADVVIIECDDVNFLNNVIHEKGQTNSNGIFVGSVPIDSAKLYFWIAHKIEGGQPYSRSGFATQNLP